MNALENKDKINKIKPVKLTPGNIFSGSKTLAVLTAPTELAFKKGNLKNHYPVWYNDNLHNDAEAAYQKWAAWCKNNTKNCYAIMADILFTRFLTYPVLVATIKKSGGRKFLLECSHIVNNRSPRWEGKGLKSGYINCLFKAYKKALETK